MHLPGYPHFYVKDGKRRPVYFTGEVRDLVALGWVKEEPSSEPTPAPEPPAPATPTAPADEPEVETSEEPAFELMTRPELLAYAMARGVDLPNNALKAELVEACRNLGA